MTNTQPDGSDLRFTKPDGTPLTYEIEQWDAGAQQAEVRVRVDTVHGNNGTQSITMFWGNPGATAISNGTAVFDTGNGFQGVWHLAQASGAAAKDATGNHFDGTPSDTAPLAVSGAIGGAQQFDGVASYIRMKGTADSKLNFPQNGAYTVSAWVYADDFSDSIGLIAGKGEEQYFLKFKGHVADRLWEFVECYDRSGWQITEWPSTTRSWVYLAGVRNGSDQYLYANEVLVDSTVRVFTDTTITQNTGNDVTIGRFLNYVSYPRIEGFCPFLGKIDVRLNAA